MTSLPAALAQLAGVILRMDGLDVQRERQDLLDAHARMTIALLDFLAKTDPSDPNHRNAAFYEMLSVRR